MKKTNLKLLTVLITVFLICTTPAWTGERRLRVVSLSPSITETIFALGRGNWLVGRSNCCNYPEAAKKVKVVGGFGTPSLEPLLEAKPDIVFTSAMKDPSTAETIKKMGVKFILLPSDSIGDYLKMVKKLGTVMDCTAAAEKEEKRIKNGIGKFQREAARVPENKRPKVFFIIWDSPLMTAGKKSFINDFIELAGGRNIGENINKDYFRCSDEWLMTSQPQVIIWPEAKASRIEELKQRPGWKILPAVKNDRIYYKINQNPLLRLGPRLLKGIEEIKQCLDSFAKSRHQ